MRLFIILMVCFQSFLVGNDVGVIVYDHTLNKFLSHIGSVEGKLVILSRDDNTLDVKCFRKNFVSQTEKTSKAISDIFSAGCLLCPENEAKARDYEVKGVFKRLWPENLAEHNSKF